MDRPQEILGAAADLFHEKGYYATTVEEIAAVVGLKKGSLYHYISGKDVLLRTLAEQTIAGYLADAQAVVAGGGRASELLERVIAAHFARLCAAPERVTVLVREAHYIPEGMAGELRRLTRAYTGIIADLIAEGIAAGELRRQDPVVAALMLLGALNWAHRWYQAEGRLSPAEIARQCTGIFVDGLRERGDGTDVPL